MYVQDFVRFGFNIYHHLILVRFGLSLKRGVDGAKLADLTHQVFDLLFKFKAFFSVVGLTVCKLGL